MTNIINWETIVMNEIDNNNYVDTLISSLIRHNIISQLEGEQIILKLIQLLTTTVNKYTGGLTSSIPVSIAKNINSSNLWCIGLFLKKHSISDNISILLHKDINYIYSCSYKELNKSIDKTKLFYNFIFCKNLVLCDNYFYNSTLKNGIDAFFKNYNSSYDACNINITVDYEAMIGRPNLLGIEFISKYLEYINYENVFCNKFNVTVIKCLLEKIYGNYQELPVNIFETVFMISLILEYQKCNVFTLNVSDIDIDDLYYDTSIDEFDNELQKSYINLMNKLSLNSNYYYDKCYQLIKNKIMNTSNNKTLEVLFGVKQEKQICYICPPKMSAKEFDNLINLLKTEINIAKVKLIRNSVKSLYDMVDILDTVDLSDAQLHSFFDSLTIIEIMLLKKYYYDNLVESYVTHELNSYIMTMDNAKQHLINNNYKLLVIM